MNPEKRRCRAKRKAQYNRYARHYGDEEATSLPFKRIGNRDFGVPFHGKDRFAGMWKKFKDRSYKERKDDGSVVTVVLPYRNSKY